MEKWETVIESKHRWFDLKLKEVFKYRDLIFLFVKRNFVTRYKQTILGPLWFIIQPLLTTLMQTVVFGSIANFGAHLESGIPYFIFNMTGNIAWGYFVSCLNGSSSTFTGNAGMFSKVYFPRLVAPISTIITCLGDFAIQLIMLAGFMAYFMLTGAAICPTWMLVLMPVLLIHMALLGLGIGSIISAVTTKYRDLMILVGFGVSLLMYASPIIYPSSMLEPGSTLHTLIMLNPVSPIIEVFRAGILGTAIHPSVWMYLGISWGVAIILLFVGIILFNKVERNFLDTV